MSFGNAVRQREEMISEYERMLKFETNPTRIEDINNKILQCQDEIAELKKGKPLFGRPKPLRQTTTIIEPDRENPGQQKVTIINPNDDSSQSNTISKTLLSPTPTTTPSTPVTKSKNTNNRLENSLRAKIQAAKAAKKTT